MSAQRLSLLLVPALALSACGGEKEAVAEPDGMELAEHADDGTTTADEMDSGQPKIREGGGRVMEEDGVPTEPVIADDAELADQEPAEVR